ncbi:hypothetical protein MITS9509_01362 [Synechococcus sp. MIT S9509]|nr:hypothetical protein MITS9509_01362 [Synechococcus sp. MIT S9509]
MTANHGQRTSTSTKRHRPDPNNQRNQQQAQRTADAVFEAFKSKIQERCHD